MLSYFSYLVERTQVDISKPIYYFPNLKMKWAVAEDKCKEWGGHLPSIQNEEENVFLAVTQGKWYVFNRLISVNYLVFNC